MTISKEAMAVREVCDSAAAFQEAVNMLWWANNPEERESADGIYPDVAEWEETHSERFTHLTRCIYEARKRFGLPTTDAGVNGG